ncbi:MAG: hypothetical protein SV760_00685, partial [Halobacteria archaeon]|nr:hypothetical protein [Halobacteria archaeon]
FTFHDADGDHVTPFEDVDPENNNEVNETLTSYLRTNLTGTECEVEVKNANRENDRDEYSVIGEVIREA